MLGRFNRHMRRRIYGITRPQRALTWESVPMPIAQEPKPLLRGWLHAAAAVAALAATIGMLMEASADTTRAMSVAIFGMSMLVLYVVSAVYHLGSWHGQRRLYLRAF